MRQYKIYTTGNKLNIIDQKTNDIYSALTTEALVRQLKDSEDGFKIYNVRDWNEDKVLKLVQLLKQDGTPYESVEDFIGNFNGGGTAPTLILEGVITQSDENAPVILTSVNTFGDVASSYDSWGTYVLSNSNFKMDKTIVQISGCTNNAYCYSDGFIQINTILDGSTSDNVLGVINETRIKIFNL